MKLRVNIGHNLSEPFGGKEDRCLTWTRIGGFYVAFFEEVDSTQLVAKRMGLGDRKVIVASSQTHGIGRLGRPWASPKGGLWFTIVLEPMTSVESIGLINLIASCSVLEALKKSYGIDALIKLPNDVYVQDRKLAGVLTEVDVTNGVVRRVLVGIGVNSNFKLTDLPEELRGSSITLMETFGNVDNLSLLRSILSVFDYNYLKVFKAGKNNEIIKTVNDRLCWINEVIRVRCGRLEHLGVFRGVDEVGNLILQNPTDGLLKIPLHKVTNLRLHNR